MEGTLTGYVPMQGGGVAKGNGSYRGRLWSTTGLVLLASSSLSVVTAHAADVVYDASTTAITTTDTTGSSDSYVIGDTGTATVTVVAPGSMSTANDLTLGNAATGDGAVTLSGATSLTANRFYIGLYGTGTLTATDGATITASGANRKVYLGNFGGSTGTLTLSGASTSLTAYDLNVAWTGNGSMTVSDGATATIEQDVTLGKNAYTTGELTITGAGSSVTSDRLYVGEIGTGELNVLDGASYVLTGTSKMYIGNTAGSVGTVTVDGTGSSIVADYLVVGWNGTGTMTVSDAATTTIATDVFVGAYGPSTGTLTVTGSGSSLTADRIYLGDSGTGYLNVLDGATVTTTGTSKIYLGNTSAGEGHATVSGAGSTLTTGDLNIGWNDTGSVTVSNSGAVVATNSISVGYANGSNGSLTVTSGGTVTVGGGTGVLQVAQLAGSFPGDIGSIGAVNIGAAAGDAAASAGTLNVGSVSFGAGAGSLVFNHTDSNYSFGVGVTGSGTIRSLAGVTSLTGDYSGFTGQVGVDGGLLSVDTTSFTNGAFNVNTGGTLRVTGSVDSVASTVTMNGGSLLNTGSIDGNQYGILFANTNASSVTTSGLIDGDLAAILYSGGGNTLSILSGASFGNKVDYAGTSGNTTSFALGSFVLPVANYLATGNTISLNNSRQVVFYSNANSASGTISVIDAGATASVYNNLQTVTSTLGATATDVLSIDVDRSGAISSRVAMAYDATEKKSESQEAIATMVGDGLAVDPYGNLFWMRGFGGRSFDEFSDAASTHYGVAFGADHMIDQTRVGVMAGAGRLKSVTDGNTSEAAGDTAFGGVYMRQPLSDYMLDASVIAGGIFTHTTREVNAGTETASGKYDGWFVSPELALSRAYALAEGWTLTPRGSIRYTYGAFDGYSESGSSMNLSYDDRSTQAVEGAFELKLSHTQLFSKGRAATVSISAAALDTYNLGDSALNGSFSGTGFSVSTLGDRNQFGGRLGLDAELKLDAQASIMGGISASRYTDDSWAFTANAGVKLKF